MYKACAQNDPVKRTLEAPKIILEAFSCWPYDKSTVSKFLNGIYLMGMFFDITGLVIFIKENSSDLPNIVACCAVLTVMMEALVRQVLLLCKRNKILKLLVAIYVEFWPSNVVERQLEERLAKESWYLNVYCATYISCAFLCGCQYYIIPLIMGNRILPIPTTYPFNWKHSPLYEIIFVLQSFYCCTVPITVVAFDWLFSGLLWNCVVQFQILSHVIQGSLGNDPNASNDKMITLIKCIKHHQKLTGSCKLLEDVYSTFLLTTIFGNTLTLCLSSFLLAVQPEDSVKMFTFCAGHTCQLLLYCYLGEKLRFESTALADAVFSGNWFASKNFTDLKNMILMIMVRSQNEVRLTVGGFGVLGLVSFLKVLKMVFSLYTLLNSMFEKNYSKQDNV